jgi:hypothetical protein
MYYVPAADFPTAVIVHMPEGAALKKFLLGKSDVSAETLSAFVASYLSGTVKPFLKSEAEPAEQGDVTVLVGTSFERIVLDTTKDVLVEFYAPW